MKRILLPLLLFSTLISFNSFAQIEKPVEPEFTTTMEFESTEFDFGVVDAGEKVRHVFKFTNTGDAPLILTNVKGSCGCTVPYFPQDPILPGESSEIEVQFDSKGKRNKQSKRVTITANTDPTHTFLVVKGEVTPADEDTREAFEAKAELEAMLRQEIETSNPSCFAIFPNPASDELQIELKEYIGKSADVEIFNEVGKKMMKEKINRISSETTRFDISHFENGMYMVSILVDGVKPMTQCFIVADR